KEDAATQINGRVVDNTLQQFVLFLVATLALSVNLTAAQMRIIPAAAMVFVVARAAFWVGYRIHPPYRAFGMAAAGYLKRGASGICTLEGVTRIMIDPRRRCPRSHRFSAAVCELAHGIGLAVLLLRRRCDRASAVLPSSSALTP